MIPEPINESVASYLTDEPEQIMILGEQRIAQDKFFPLGRLFAAEGVTPVQLADKFKMQPSKKGDIKQLLDKGDINTAFVRLFSTLGEKCILTYSKVSPHLSRESLIKVEQMLESNRAISIRRTYTPPSSEDLKSIRTLYEEHQELFIKCLKCTNVSLHQLMGLTMKNIPAPIKTEILKNMSNVNLIKYCFNFTNAQIADIERASDSDSDSDSGSVGNTKGYSKRVEIFINMLSNDVTLINLFIAILNMTGKLLIIENMLYGMQPYLE